MYVYIYVYIYVCVYIYTHTYIHRYIYCTSNIYLKFFLHAVPFHKWNQGVI